MDHNQAVARKAPERYLLEEMTEPERFDFEDHYFGCEECAEDVRVGAAMARGIHAVGPLESSPRPLPKSNSWKSLFTPWLVPSFAGGACAILAVWQAVVIIPPLREARMLSPVVLRAAARGDEPTIVFKHGAALSVLAMDVNSGEPGQSLTWELQSPAGTTALGGSSEVPAAGSQLLLVLPKEKIGKPGSWTMILRTPQGEIARYPFKVELK